MLFDTKNEMLPSDLLLQEGGLRRLLLRVAELPVLLLLELQLLVDAVRGPRLSCRFPLFGRAPFSARFAFSVLSI